MFCFLSQVYVFTLLVSSEDATLISLLDFFFSTKCIFPVLSSAGQCWQSSLPCVWALLLPGPLRATEGRLLGLASRGAGARRPTGLGCQSVFGTLSLSALASSGFSSLPLPQLSPRTTLSCLCPLTASWKPLAAVDSLRGPVRHPFSVLSVLVSSGAFPFALRSWILWVTRPGVGHLFPE